MNNVLASLAFIGGAEAPSHSWVGQVVVFIGGAPSHSKVAFMGGAEASSGSCCKCVEGRGTKWFPIANAWRGCPVLWEVCAFTGARRGTKVAMPSESSSAPRGAHLFPVLARMRSAHAQGACPALAQECS